MHNVDPIVVDVDAAGLYALSLADGSRRAGEICASLEAEFGLAAEAARSTLETLFDKQVVVDAQERPALMDKGRYARHKLFYESTGNDGERVQQRLADAHVVIVGAGGIGNWLSYYLVAAGVGTVTLIDGDTVAPSNLTRQVLFHEGDVGSHKVAIAKRRLDALGTGAQIRAQATHVRGTTHLRELIQGIPNLVVCAGDQAPLNDWIDEYSQQTGCAWSSCGYHHSVAVCGPMIVPGRTPSRRQLVASGRVAGLSELPFLEDINKRFVVPSFAPTNGLAASVQAKEAIALLADIRAWQRSVGACIMLDGLTLQARIVPTGQYDREME